MDCYVSKLKATGLFTDAKVQLKPAEDGKWLDIFITPTPVRKIRKFEIRDIRFEGFDGFDVAAIRAGLREKGFEPGVPLFKYPLNEIGEMLEGATAKIYASNEEMLERMRDEDVGFHRFQLQVTDVFKVRLTISLHKEDPCNYLGCTP